MMSHRENWLRAIEFRGPEWIQGGLMLSAGVWGAHVPLANTEAICAAMEEFCFG